MARKKRIPAGQCPPGKYKSKSGTLVVVVSKINTRWRQPWMKRKGYIPYRAPASPRSKGPAKHITRYGWLPPDYPLLPVD